MTSKSFGVTSIDSLAQAASQSLQAEQVTAVLLALGSNHQAHIHLPQVRAKLAKLGTIELSSPYQNPDFTATSTQPKPDYVNQGIYLSLNSPVTLARLEQMFATIEHQCGRNRIAESQQSVKEVTMDIDILLIKLTDTKCKATLSSYKNSLSERSASHLLEDWIVMTDRYPFKAHEILGIKELSLK